MVSQKPGSIIYFKKATGQMASIRRHDTTKTSIVCPLRINKKLPCWLTALLNAKASQLRKQAVFSKWLQN